MTFITFYKIIMSFSHPLLSENFEKPKLQNLFFLLIFFLYILFQTQTQGNSGFNPPTGLHHISQIEIMHIEQIIG